MRNRYEVTARCCAGCLQPSPEIAGIGAVVETKRRKCLRLRSVNVSHHYAMQVGAAGDQRILPANQRGEFPGLIVRISRIGNQLPSVHLYRRLPRNQTADTVFVPPCHCCHRILSGLGQNRSKQLTTRLFVDRVPQQILYKPRPEPLSPSEPLVNNGVQIEAANDAKVLRMIGDHQKIEGRPDLHSRFVPRMNNGHALRIAVGRIRRGR